MNKLSIAFILNLLFHLFAVSYSNAQLSLILRSERSSYQLGEPLIVTVELKNEGSDSLKVIKYLNPDYMFTSYKITNIDGKEIPYSPVTILNVRRSYTTTLTPGESLFGTAKIFFGNKGWLFDKPGNYKIIATHTSLENNHISSNELNVEIRSPIDDAHRQAAELMMISEVGIFLLWEGGDQFTKGISALQRVANELPETVHAIYANFGLGMNLSIDQGERKANLDKATIYLEKARKLSKEKVSSDYIRSNTLLQLYDIYKKTSKKVQQDEIRRVFREEFKENKRFEKQLQKIARE